MDILTLAVAKNSVSSTPGQKGDKGDTGAQGIQGIQGEKGDKGETGDSAYEIAKKNGFVGTEEEWLESLKVDESTVKSIVDKVVEDSVNEISENISQLSKEINDLGGIVDYVVTEAEEVIGKVINAQSERTFNMAVITDLHNNGGVSDVQILHACQGVGYIADRIKLDVFACLGDLTDASVSSNWTECVADILACNNHKHKLVRKTDFMELIGNHDYKAKNSPITYKLISAFSDNVVWGSKLGGYFYKDYDEYKLRIIGLNTSSGGSHISVSSEQYNWFIETLDLSSKEDATEWQMLIISHVPLDWDGFKFTYILNAYINGTSWSDSTYSCDYTNKNKATIIGNVHGHLHNLMVDKLYLGDASTSTEQINIYRIAIPEVTESYGNQYESPYKHSVIYGKTSNTAEDTSFNILCINLDNNRIDAICYGAGVDRAIDYAVFENQGGTDDPSISYTNLVPTSLALSGTGVYGTNGYKDGYYISSSGGGDSDDSTCVTTGLISYNIPSTGIPKPIYIKGAEYKTLSHVRIGFYKSDKSFKVAKAGSDIAGLFTIETLGDLYYKLTPIAEGDNSKLYTTTGLTDGDYYFRLSLVGTGANLIVTLDEPIE